MVDLMFTARTKHFIPLALLRYVAALTTDEPPEEINYIGESGVKTIKGTRRCSFLSAVGR